MNRKERIKAILKGTSPDRTGFWLGNPKEETKIIFREALGIQSDSPQVNKNRLNSQERWLDTVFLDIELHNVFQSDFYWVCPDLDPQLYQHPEGKLIFDKYGGKPKKSLSQAGVFAGCDEVKEIEEFEWPDPDYLDFSNTIKAVERINELKMGIFSGMWSPFFHDICDLFGMENYFIKMLANPKVVEAVTERVLAFYLEANKKCLDLIADKIEAVFFGNDLGSQTNVLLNPELFKRFIYPGIVRIVKVAKSYDLPVILHSCGAIYDFIPAFLEAGIDGLHPLQIRAKGMEAERLSDKFRDELVFIGGVDTQSLLPFGSPEQVKREVFRLKSIFGERFIVSPSHETLLPNVSINNALAMRDAALG